MLKLKHGHNFILADVAIQQVTILVDYAVYYRRKHYIRKKGKQSDLEPCLVRFSARDWINSINRFTGKKLTTKSELLLPGGSGW